MSGKVMQEMDRSLWIEGKNMRGHRSMRAILRYAGRRYYDPDRLINSALGDKIMETMGFWYFSDCDEDAPEVHEYWRALGIKKELHEKEDYMKKWSALIPLSVYAPENAGKKWPVVFQLHGGSSPIFYAEHYGFSHLSAKEGFITIYPQDRYEQNIRRIWDEVQKLYPVDLSRVYVHGFSMGGVYCHNISARCTDIFAACATSGVQPMLDTLGLPEEFDAVMLKAGMPGIHICGEEEVQNIAPFSVEALPDNSRYSIEVKARIKRETELGHRKPSIPAKEERTDDDKLEMFNRKMRVSGCREVTREECDAALKNEREIVEEKLGIPCEEKKVLTRYEKKHYIADFRNGEGVVMCRVCCIQDQPHWCTYDHAELCWDFMKRFTRDPETKKLSCNKTAELI